MPLSEELSNDNIGFRNATFSWSLDEDSGKITPSSRVYKLHIDGDLLFKVGNLSVGQRQIIALSRAMIRGCKLLMLDEGE